MANSIQQLQYLGQSVWYDNMSRDLIASGELERLIEAQRLINTLSLAQKVLNEAPVQKRMTATEVEKATKEFITLGDIVSGSKAQH